MEKKYKLTNETININGTTLYRIEALKNFFGVKKGDKGGLSKYASGIEILEPYLQNDMWNINTIYQRSKDLYQLIVKFWSTKTSEGIFG